MIDFKRILAHAIARRVVYVVVAMALAWMGIGSARAQSCGTLPPLSCSQGANCSEGAAYASAMAWTTVRACQFGYTNPSVVSNGVSGNHGIYACLAVNGSGSNVVLAGECAQYLLASTCSAQAPLIGAPPTSTQTGQVRQGSISCVGGCAASWYNNGDGTWTGVFSAGAACTDQTLKQDCSSLGPGRYWNAYLQACEPPLEECSANEVKDSATGECQDACPAGMKTNAQGQCEPEGNECPAGQIKSPDGSCLPGDGQCAAGEARRPNGTCGKDSNGDGVADDDDEDPENDSEKETFSGGDNCNSPPSCSGGPIMCGMARIQWRIDCNTRKNRNISGGACGAMPICTGEKCDALEYSSLLMQWRTACALEKQASDGGTGEGGQPEWTKVTGMSQDPGAGETPEDLEGVKVKTLSVNDLDTSGVGGAAPGTCPALLGSGVGGTEFTSGFLAELASPSPEWCGWIGNIYAIVLMLAAAASCVILASGGRS